MLMFLFMEGISDGVWEGGGGGGGGKGVGGKMCSAEDGNILIEGIVPSLK